MHESFSARVGSIPSLYTLQTWQLLRSLAAGVDLRSLDGRRAVRCIDGIDIVEDAERFVRVAQEVYKALGAPSRSGQFGAFSSERTEWMDHKDPVGHRAAVSGLLHPGSTTFSVVHGALIPCLSVCPCFSSSMGLLIVGRCQAARW